MGISDERVTETDGHRPLYSTLTKHSLSTLTVASASLLSSGSVFLGRRREESSVSFKKEMVALLED